MATVETLVNEKREAWLEELKALLRVPSVSADPARAADMSRCCAMVEDHVRRLGFKVERVETAGHPLVVAERREDAALPTVLIYGHYDVQPPDPLDLWRHGAFNPTVEDGNLIARGATDDKGQIFAHLKGIEATLAAKGRLPVNVILLIEGEEEVGSKGVTEFLVRNAARLACDVAVISDGSQHSPGVPAITYGLRGITALELRVQGPSHDLHSGSFGGAIANPAVVLARIVATFHTADGRVAVRGFYDDVDPLTPEERKLIASLPFDEAAYLAGIGAVRSFGEPGFSILERTGSRPTLEVNGIFGGYSGEGSKTIIPAWAGVKITCRLVPHQDPGAITRAVADHARAAAPDTVTLTIQEQHGAPAFLTSHEGPAMNAARRALARAFGHEPVAIREGGSIPLVSVMADTLHAPILLLGFGQHDDRAHSPNEKFAVSDFYGGIRASAFLLEELATVARR